MSRSPLCSIYKGIIALYWPSIINYQLLPHHSVLYWTRTQTGQTDLTFKLDFPGNLCLQGSSRNSCDVLHVTWWMWSTRVWVRQCEITSKIIFCFAYINFIILSTLYIFWFVQKHPVYFTCDTMLEKRGCECDSVKLAWKWDVIKFYQPACHENRSGSNYLSGQGYRSYYINLNLCQFDKHTSPIAMKLRL